MGVRVEEQWRYKRVRSERASKSAFAYKINGRLKSKGRSKVSYGFSTSAPYSREVIVKITGGARSKKGINNAVDYISQGWQGELTDSNGIRHKTKEDMQSSVDILQQNVASSVKLNPTKQEKLTYNMVFSAPKIAEVRREDALEAVSHVLKEKYPDNYFVTAYHDETKNSHVHVVLNIHKDTGEKIDIRKKDLRDLREGFCENLIKYGYDVKATRKYGYKLKELEELSLRENRNIYEVVDFGTASYQVDKRNDKNSYLIYKTSNDKEVTIWGKEILDEVTRNNIKKGDLVAIKKTGQVDIKVPVYGSDGATIMSWRASKRNHWQIEKAGADFNAFSTDHPQEIKLDSSEQAAKQLEQREKFEHEKQVFLGLSAEERLKLEPELHHKSPKHSLRF